MNKNIMHYIRRRIKFIASFLLLNFMNQLLFPVFTYALTSGPTSPEFSSFEPVSTTNMVDPFSGDFTYNLPILNIPGPEGGGYAMSLSYHSGVTPEEEASWVGYGWTLNPGSLNRNKKGYPDEFNGAKIVEYNKARPNWSASSVVEGSLELFSKDSQKNNEDSGGSSSQKDTANKTSTLDAKDTKLSISMQKSVRMNNYKGFYSTYGFGVGVMGMGSLNMTTGRQGTTFGITVNPLQILRKKKASKEKAKYDNEKKVKINDKKTLKILTNNFNKSVKNGIKKQFNRKMTFSSSDFGGYDVPFSVSTSLGISYSRSLSVQPSFFDNFGIQAGASGSFNVQVPPASRDMKAYGYINSPDRTVYEEEDNNASFGNSSYGKVLADFTVERDAPFSKRDKFLGIPFGNADQFITTGEKVMGGFRAHHKQMGVFYPSGSESKMTILPFGLELAVSMKDATIGLDFGRGFQTTEMSNWTDGNVQNIDDIITNLSFEGDPVIIDGIEYKKIPVSQITTLEPYKYLTNEIISKAEDFISPNSNEPVYIRIFNDSVSLPTHIKNNKRVSLNGYDHLLVFDNELRPEPFDVSDINNIFNGMFNSTAFENNDDGYVYILNEIKDLKFEDEAVFKFTQDPANEWCYTDFSKYKDPTAANLSPNINLPIALGAKFVSPNVSSLGISSKGGNQDLSSKIEYHTFGELTDELCFAKHDNVKQLREVYIGSLNTGASDSEKFDDAIAEFQVIGDDGSRTVYGLPVFTRNEASVSVDVNVFDDDNISSDDIENDYIAYKDNLYFGDDMLKNKQVNGTYSPTPYAVNHLLTEITNINYIDLTDNGPTDDDIGGWTRFDYRHWKGEDWYNYRMPYNGLFYQKGEYSDPKDDVGSVTRGEKQVMYLKGIETKTHYAFFVTNLSEISDFADLSFYDSIDLTGRLAKLLRGSQEDRQDSYPAKDLNYGSSTTDPSVGKDVMPNDVEGLERLEKIVLVAKSRLDQPLSVAYFEYDYSLCKGAPNNLKESSERNGKLTLKKVWFESDGVVRNKIAPYKFEYQYPKHTTDNPYFSLNPDNEEKYESILSFYGQTRQENPDYKPYALDPWGNYRSNGEQLARNHFKWVNQHPDSYFDPAAWNLKKIVLPSGGEILVQYEQKDYAYVQNEKAATMQKITIDSDSYDDASYYVDLPSNMTNEEKELYEKELQEYYYTDGGPVNYIYFHFLYSVSGGSASLNSNGSEYITGYTTVRDVTVDGNRIKISLGDKDSWSNGNKISKRDGITFPREVCYDYYISNRDGFFNESSDSYFSTYWDKVNEIDKQFQNIIDSDDIAENFEPFKRGDIKKSARNAILDVFGHAFRTVQGKKKVCQSLNEDHSYLRVPVFKSKKGGGVRVKRLLMYDKGMETGEENLYGSEYYYLLEDGTSSGVATNEPSSANEENPLVKLLPRSNNNFIRKVFVGDERKQQEGPLGQTVMSGASVGYSRVVVENIHKGSTGTGYQVHKFNTCKEYPFFAEASSFSKNNKQKDWLKLPLGLININIRKAWYSQGYTFVKNNMHGKSKSVATFAGTFEPEVKDNFDAAVSYTKTNYFEEGEKVKCLTSNHDQLNNLSLKTIDKLPGLEEDIAVVDKMIKDKILDFTIEFDITIQWGQPFAIIPRFNLAFNYSYNEYGTNVMSKVWNMPAIVKSTTSYAQGVTTTTENLAFDVYTGKPIVTKTYDGFHDMVLTNNQKHNGSFYSYNIPAHLIYDGMGLKTKNLNNTNQLTDVAGQFVAYGKANNDTLAWIDLLNSHAINPYEVAPEGVISASAVVYENNIYSQDNSLSNSILNNYISEHITDPATIDTINSRINKNYKPVATYSYKGDVSDANSDNEGLIFQSGDLNSFSFFNWLSDDIKDSQSGKYKNHYQSWILGSEITAYSPGGIPLEERNVLDINSAVRLGYDGDFLPVILAQNASYNSIFFEDFENSNNPSNSQNAHSGKKAMQIVPGADVQVINQSDDIKLTDQIQTKGAVVKAWVKANDDFDPEFKLENGALEVSINSSANKVPMKKVGASGEWELFHAYIDDCSDIESQSDENITLNISSVSQGNVVLYIDDICFQPYDSEVSCNVYDIATFKLIAQFNSQHFGVFYHYNDEGNLVYKSIETERGKKMIQEQQHNIVRKDSRTSVFSY